MICLHPGLPNTINTYIGPEVRMVHKLLFVLSVASHEPAKSSQTLFHGFIDHCNIDFHWVRHRNITIK